MFQTWVCVCPHGGESYGAWGEEASAIISSIASRLATFMCKPKWVVLNDIYGRLSVHLVHANATAIFSRIAPPPSLCKKGCYTVLYNACIHVLCTRYTRVIRICITLRMDTLYTVAYNNYSITLCITSV